MYTHKHIPFWNWEEYPPARVVQCTYKNEPVEKRSKKRLLVVCLYSESLGWIMSTLRERSACYGHVRMDISFTNLGTYLSRSLSLSVVWKFILLSWIIEGGFSEGFVVKEKKKPTHKSHLATLRISFDGFFLSIAQFHLCVLFLLFGQRWRNRKPRWPKHKPLALCFVYVRTMSHKCRLSFLWNLRQLRRAFHWWKQVVAYSYAKRTAMKVKANQCARGRNSPQKKNVHC